MNTISEVVRRQFEFQEKMNSNTAEMYLALVTELGELIDSMGVFTWKPSERDEKNMDMELIDIAVFAINLAFYEDNLKPTKVLAMPNDDYHLVMNIVNLLAARRYIDIAYSILQNRAYVDIITAKQALNQLRQDYGYKKGEYQKQWGKVEDNVYLEQFYGLDYETIYNSMEDIYVNKVIKGLILNVFDN